MVKNINKKVKRPGKLIRTISVALLALGLTGALYKTGNDKVKNYINNNPTFAKEKVEDVLDFYGGDTRYITINKNLLGLGLDKIYNHLDLNGDEYITISYEDSVSEDKREQFQHTFNYLNNIFEIINPEIKFEVVNLQKNDSDIYIQMRNMQKDTGMKVEWDIDFVNRSKLVGGVISVNKNLEFTDTELRYYMLHEMFHILTGSKDVNEKDSPTFSIFNYEDVGFINYQIENAFTSKEEKKEAFSDGKFHHDFPVMSEELKKSYVSFLPTDLGTLIALYGDSGVEQNKKNYLVLMINTVDECKLIFGNQPYFANKKVLENLKNELDKINAKQTEENAFGE